MAQNDNQFLKSVLRLIFFFKGALNVLRVFWKMPFYFKTSLNPTLFTRGVKRKKCHRKKNCGSFCIGTLHILLCTFVCNFF